MLKMHNAFGSVGKYTDNKETFTALTGQYTVQKHLWKSKKIGRSELSTAAQTRYLTLKY